MAAPQRVADAHRARRVRVARAWRALAPEQRFSALAALSLWLTMFLPVVQRDRVVSIKNAQQPAS